MWSAAWVRKGTKPGADDRNGWYPRGSMICIKRLLYLAPVLVLAGGALLCAQTDPQADKSAPPQRIKIVPAPEDMDQMPAGKVKELPLPATAIKAPFDVNGTKPDAGGPIRVLSEEQMSREDRDLVADAQSSIQERAGFENLDFNGSGWTYRQLDCPALPNHLFLRFTRDDGTREMSMFSAAIPRNGNGRVHIIPIVRRGYSLFSPAPIGAMTIAAFNRIREEEGEGAAADWLGTGLCYAALAGANPQGAPHAIAEETGDAPVAIPPTLVVKSDGGAVIRFVDLSTDHLMEWNLTFANNGKLMKATHTPASLFRYQKGMHTEDVNKAMRNLPQQ